MMMAAEAVSARLPPPSQTRCLWTHSALNALPESGGFAFIILLLFGDAYIPNLHKLLHVSTRKDSFAFVFLI
jgi:hypothetical protein